YTRAFDLASLAGSLAFAISGFLVGARRQLDVMGIFILAFMTANGGGVLRDVLIGRQPAILGSAEPFWLSGAVTLGCWALGLKRFSGLERNWLFIVTDGIGLVAFGIAGALAGVSTGAGFFGVLTLALLTAVGGGMIRDLLVNEVPEVLRGGFYGSVALLLGA